MFELIDFTRNGFLVQNINQPTNFVNSFSYYGINSYVNFPLSLISNAECYELTKRQQLQKFSDNTYRILEFISDDDLLVEYLECCQKHNIDIRVLMIESPYTEENYPSNLCCSTFIGYEYCPIPIDQQIITDIDWCPMLHIFKKQLNSFGLFSEFGDVYNFRNVYDTYCKTGLIGDGLEFAYICKVYEINVEKYLSIHQNKI